MTEQKALKRRVRARMSDTGERYTTARRQILARRGTTLQPPAGMTADAVVRERTGRGWVEWFEILEKWGGRDRSHSEIARWLNAEQRVDGWWSQQITVGYEIAVGRRVVGQRGASFSATATRTIAVPPERALQAVTDEATRAAWLPGATLRPRKTTARRSARFDWDDGDSRVIFGFMPSGEAKCRVAMEHERLPDAEAASRMKAYWRERLGALKELLER